MQGMRNAVFRAYWLPRLQNEEADALTVSVLRQRDLSTRFDDDQSKPGFVLRNNLFSAGVAYVVELASLKDLEKVPKEFLDSVDDDSLEKRGDTLRERDPCC